MKRIIKKIIIGVVITAWIIFAIPKFAAALIPLQVNQGGTGSSAFTSGSIPISNGTILTQDNANVFYDATNKFFGHGTNTPTANFQITQPTIAPGTVAVSGTAVTGTGTKFTNTFKKGDTITVTTSSGSETKAITTVTDDTHLVTAAFTGTASAGTAYTLVGGDRFVLNGNGNLTMKTAVGSIGINLLGVAGSTGGAYISGGNAINTNPPVTNATPYIHLWQLQSSNGSIDFNAGFGSIYRFQDNGSTYMLLNGANSGATPTLTLTGTSQFTSRVGIGQVASTAFLEILGSNNQLRLISAANGIQSMYSIDGVALTAAYYSRNDGTNNGLHIENRLSGGVLALGGNTSQQDLIILNSGNVGIGQTTPTAQLHVVSLAGVAGGTGTAATKALTVLGGAGGNSSTTSTAGGLGGAITLTSGAGGNSTGVAGTNGADITLQGGAGGTGSSTGNIGNILLQTSGGNVGIGATPVNLLYVSGSVASGTDMVVAKNTLSTGFAGFAVLGNTGNRGGWFKTGTTYSGYKNLQANDMGFYNDTNAGNISILNDYSSGNINFAAGGSGSIQFSIGATGAINVANLTGSMGVFTDGSKNLISLPATQIVGNARMTGLSAAQALATLTVPASDTSYAVSANVLVTTATLHNFTITCTYTDEGNTSRTVTLPFQLLAGTAVTAITNAQGTVPYEGSPIHIRAKGGTTIIIASTGTFTTVVYNLEERILAE